MSADAPSSPEERARHIRENIVGAYERFASPYGDKPIVYMDWVASGRMLRSVEQQMERDVLPLYGNIHTKTSVTTHQSTCYRQEARQIVGEAVNAKISGKSAEDVVLFTGNGTTNAISKLIQSLGLHMMSHDAYSGDDNSKYKPVVFTSSYEHHSNLLPWREVFADIVTIKYSFETGVCIDSLKDALQTHKDRVIKIGTFSAASNVTGILTAVDAISAAMHRAGGIALFDYATAAPYVKMDMNPITYDEDAPYVYKDAIFFSGHKFVGGPGCPGVLAVKKKLLPSAQECPTVPGGGTVFYVTEDHHRYLYKKEEREEGGTPNILGDIKLGVVLHVKRQLGAAWIEEKEMEISAYARDRLRSNAAVVLLGRDGDKGNHLPIFSFLIRKGSRNRFLHFNFVCALLNDLFGVQSRGGCSCAGPYSQFLLGIDSSSNELLERALLDKHEMLRPGYTRVSLPYWLSRAEIDYVVDAILFVAQSGAHYLPKYTFNPATGLWAHRSLLTHFPSRKWISSFDVLRAAPLPHAAAAAQGQSPLQQVLSGWDGCRDVEQLLSRVMQEARASLLSAAGDGSADTARVVADPAVERCRWFYLPGDDDLLSAQNILNPITIDSSAAYIEKRQSTRGALEVAALPTSNYISKRSHLLQSRSGFEGARPAHKEEIFPTPVAAATPVTTRAVAKPQTSSSSSSSKDGSLLQTFPGDSEVFKRYKFTAPPKKLMRAVGRAMNDWSMVQEGDRLLLGLSGGKDSLSLLQVLVAVQRRAPVRFEIACATVDPQTDSFDPSPLIPYLQAMGITYHYLAAPIVDSAKTKLQGDSLCAYCARMKRGLLYTCCRSNGYNKLVLAQHLDDLAESFVMSCFHNGQARTMKANYTIKAGDVKVIRPLIYTRERETLAFSRECRLPVINENCPACFEVPKERARIKALLSQEEVMYPNLFSNLKNSLMPLMHGDSHKVMSALAERSGNPYSSKASAGHGAGSKRSGDDTHGNSCKKQRSTDE